MAARLVAYDYVPSGFEMVIDPPDVEMGKVWNLWWNVTLSDDPSAWDGEIRLLHEMQGRLDGLTTDQRLIRAQMGEFCRAHPLFPQSIEILCQEIGTGRLDQPQSLGCEGRGLLDSLGYYDPQSLSNQRGELLTGYAHALKRWLGTGQAESPLESKVSGFLGQPTRAKERLAEKLITALDGGDASISSFKNLSRNECRLTQGEPIFETGARPFNCFDCEGCPEGASVPGCQCCTFMVVDAGLLCAGTSGEERSMFDEFRRFVEENILAYALALNAWLRDAPPEPTEPLPDGRYVDHNRRQGLTARVQASLGEKDGGKEWLAACLLKTIKDNQRWHNKTELIDGVAEAISWFGEQQAQISHRQAKTI